MQSEILGTAADLVTSVSSIGVLAYAMGHQPLAGLGTEVAVVIGTLVAIAGVADLVDRANRFASSN